ncbi:MAG: nuclease [Pseudonocardiaceae bacterium]|nr:nuclease [Pseudonocardiaceae bacterium]
MPNGTVVDVIDGDTVDVAVDGGGTKRVRVLGIDTPEMFGAEQCWGREASDFAERTLAGQRVRLDSDPTQDDRDAYDRALRYLVFPDARNYSVLAAEAGAARPYVYETPVLLHPEIVAGQQRAQAADAGLWGTPCYGVTDELAVVEPAPAPAPEPAPVPDTAYDAGSGGGVAYYENCSAARAAGADPLYAGEAGYSSKLDRDGDGVACE